MKRTVLFLVLGASSAQLSASWIKVYGYRGDTTKEWGYRVVQTSDGGYAVVGQTGYLGGDTWLLKTDSEGDTLWTRSYTFGSCCCIQVTPDGGYVLAGNFYSPNYQLMLIRTDAIGDTLWTLSCGGPDSDVAYWVCTTSDGGFAATGYSDKSSGVSENLYLVRTGPYGDTIWTRKYGGELRDFGRCVEQTPDGGFIVTGYSNSFSLYEDADVWLLKTDSLGDTLWTRTFGGENGDGGDQVILTSDGGYAIAGIYDLTGSMYPTSGDVLLIKTDSAGNLEWQKTYGIFIEMAYGLNQTSDGGYIVVGAKEGLEPTGRDLWLLKTDALGDTLWTRTIAARGSDAGLCVNQTADGGYIITGSTHSFGPGEEVDYDLWLIKTDSLGLLDIEESPVTHLPDFEIVNPVIPVGGNVVLRYENYPQGFRASIYDATGRKVDSIESRASFGSISWGMGYSPGVYIIREEQGTKAKVVLVK